MASIHCPFITADEFHKNCLNSEMHEKKLGHPDYWVQYRGCMLPYPFHLSLNELETFKARPEDICIATFPKAGQLLTSALVVMIENKGHPDSLTSGAPLKLKVPYLEMAYPRKGSWNDPIFPIQHLKKLHGARIYGTHHNANSLPAQVVNTAKIIYVYRNPKDTIVSLYYFMLSGFRAWDFKGTLANAVDMVVSDKCAFAPFFEHLESFWKIRNQSNIHLTSFERILKDPKREIQSLSHFLERDLNEKQIMDVMHHCSFDKMKHNPNTNYSEHESLGFIDMTISPFLRSGTVGNWKKHLTVELNAKIDEWIEKNLATRPGLSGIQFEYE